MTAKLTRENYARESAFIEKLGVSYGRRRLPEIRERFGGGNYCYAYELLTKRYYQRHVAFRKARELRGSKRRKVVVLRQLTQIRGIKRYVWYVAERKHG